MPKTPVKHLMVFLILVGLQPLYSQQQTGIRIGPKSTTRAVVVGISDYEDAQIPDLMYSHKDAQAFSEYLKSQAGGSLPEENIKSFYNEDATGGNIHKALYWLVNESNENDECIIYFSGHGDVETIYEDEPGHFLVYDSPFNIYQINSLRIEDLNRIIKTLSVQKKAKVKLFTDACRAGKLAGSEINGAQATASSLNKQFANEIKVMSCQANEYSIEGEEFGGGRGVFSYRLIEGMSGLADSDGNLQVSLKELQRYLEDKVHESLGNDKQTPLTVGDRNSIIAYVDEEILAEINVDTKIESSPIADSGLAARSNGLVEKFYQALENKDLLNSFSPNKDGSAESLFDLISANEEYENRLPIIKGDYIAKLQDDAQEAINKYLSLDDEEMRMRLFGDSWAFDKFGAYLAKAANLLGEIHYLYPQVKVKQIYFEVLNDRLHLNKSKAEKKEYAILEQKLKDAFIYQARSPFLNNELGMILKLQGKNEESLQQFDEAIKLSPKWALPVNNKSAVYNSMGAYNQALELANQALALNDKFASPKINLALAYEGLGNYESALSQTIESFTLTPENCTLYNNAGFYNMKLGNLEEAEKYYNQGLECDPNYSMLYNGKAVMYMQMNKYQEAIEVLKLAESRDIPDSRIKLNLAICYEELKDFNLAEEQYLLILEKQKSHPKASKYLAMMYLANNQLEKSIQYFDQHIQKVGDNDAWVYFDKACAHAALNQLDLFEVNMESAFQNGESIKEEIKKEMEDSEYLSSIKSSEKFTRFLDY